MTAQRQEQPSPPGGSGAVEPALDRRRVLQWGCALGAAALGASLVDGGGLLLADSGVGISTRAFDLAAGATVVDMLGLLTTDWPKLRRWHRDPSTFRESDFRRLEATGVNVFHPAVDLAQADPHRAAQRWLAGWNSLLTSRPCFLLRVDSLADLIPGGRVGRLTVLLGLQSSDHFRTPVDVEPFWRLGQRVSQLTYNSRCRLGDGCWVRPDRGLTGFGAEVVAEMNRVGMAIDVSHCGERTSLDAIRLSRKPVLATHANCKALVPHQPRNKSDEVIRHLAAGGGVMGIALVRGFVRSGRPTLDDVLDHFDHVRDLVGVEHVGLGSDLACDSVDPATGRPLQPYAIGGLDLDLRVFQLIDGLLGRGYDDRDVELILGGNFLRAFTEIASGSGRSSSSASPLPPRDPFCPAPRPAGPGPGR